MLGVTKNITTFNKIYYYTSSRTLDKKTLKELRQKRKTEERNVLLKIIRDQSGLPKNVLAELKIWEEMFHDEVHGSKFSFFFELDDWIKTKKAPSLGPIPNDRNMVLYLNRAVEISWMLTKLLIYLQPENGAFGSDWLRKYKLLDKSFLFSEQILSNLGKPVADAFIYFMNDKFSFPNTFHYFEPDGSS